MFINRVKKYSSNLLLIAFLATFCAGEAFARGLDRTYIRGADLSTILDQEIDGTIYQEYGVAKDVLEIFQNHDLNWIRIRLFVNPDLNHAGAYQDLDYVTTLAARAKAMGYQFLLDFHYTDSWAGPGWAPIPEAWTNEPNPEVYDLETCLTKAFEYNRDVIAHLAANGAMPEMVQLGNESADGIFEPWGDRSNDVGLGGWSNMVAIINECRRGVDAGRGDYPMPEIMLHHWAGGGGSVADYYYKRVINDGSLTGGVLYDWDSVDFDVLGLSFYGTNLQDLNDCIDRLSGNYPNHDIVYAEYGTHFTTNQNSSPELQKAFVEDVHHAIRNAPNGLGRGAFYWQPEWYYGNAAYAGRATFAPVEGETRTLEMLLAAEGWNITEKYS
ncbi:MAG: arabinogalactan endo-1,4-beta-galactosidase, partial [Kiritimatiellaceae bacterium]|nr:arabinogalactan endo-1,4-beta-galactosidase [Kiritimatiellaceae bacterium]